MLFPCCRIRTLASWFSRFSSRSHCFVVALLLCRFPHFGIFLLPSRFPCFGVSSRSSIRFVVLFPSRKSHNLCGSTLLVPQTVASPFEAAMVTRASATRRRNQPTITATNTSCLAMDDGPNESGDSREEARSSPAAEPGGSGPQTPDLSCLTSLGWSSCRGEMHGWDPSELLQ